MQLLSRDVANRIDEYLIKTVGIPRDILIEHAAAAVAKSCICYLEKQKNGGHSCTVHVFAGKGMNGSDAFACARNLHALGYAVHLWDVFPQKTAEESWQIRTDKNLGIPVRPAKEYQPGGDSLVVDGIFGTAFTIERKFSISLKNLFQKINAGHEAGSHIISIDLPSGVEADTGATSKWTILADETVTFICPKIGIASYPGKKYAGTVHIDSIGFSKPWLEKLVKDISSKSEGSEPLPVLIDMAEAGQWLSKRPVDGHKGTFGKAGLIGGSEGMAGSICLSALALMRCGVGLTYMRVPRRIEADCLAVVPEALISTDYKPAMEGTDAVLIGPGMDRTKKSSDMLWLAIETIQRLVLDAGALNILAQHQQEMAISLKKRQDRNLLPVILTPHPGEFQRLFPGLASLDRVGAARTAARQLGVVLVLKGAGTVIADPEGRTYINSSGNSAMAKGGSGDVLSGIITAFLAQGKTPVIAAAFAVFFHGLCGDLAARESGEYASLPKDFIQKIPDAFRALEESRRAKSAQCADFK